MGLSCLYLIVNNLQEDISVFCRVKISVTVVSLILSGLLGKL